MVKYPRALTIHLTSLSLPLFPLFPLSPSLSFLSLLSLRPSRPSPSLSSLSSLSSISASRPSLPSLCSCHDTATRTHTTQTAILQHEEGKFDDAEAMFQRAARYTTLLQSWLLARLSRSHAVRGLGPSFELELFPSRHRRHLLPAFQTLVSDPRFLSSSEPV